MTPSSGSLLELGTWRSVLATIAAGGALYGAVLGSWHGTELALYTAIKLPLVLLATAASTAAFQSIVARAAGLRLESRGALFLSCRGLATSSLLLASLAPVALLFTRAAQAPGAPAGAAHTAHNFLYLVHTLLVAVCGLRGVLALGERLRKIAPSATVARRVLAAWLGVFALVGGEVAWVFRPFVGSVYEPVAFLRRDALSGNVYELLFTDVVPHLLGLDRGDRP